MATQVQQWASVGNWKLYKEGDIIAGKIMQKYTTSFRIPRTVRKAANVQSVIPLSK